MLKKSFNKTFYFRIIYEFFFPFWFYTKNLRRYQKTRIFWSLFIRLNLKGNKDRMNNGLKTNNFDT